jgi:hypothetical protein
LLWHVARHVARLVAPLVVNYFASRRLVVDYFAYATRRVPRHVARLVTRLVVDYFASRRLLIDYFTYAARPCASTRRTARCRLLRQRRAFGCLDTSRGSLHRSSSTTSPTPRVRVPRHIACLVTRLVVDYFAYTVCPGASARLAARQAVHHRILHLHRTSGCFGLSRGL